MVGICLCGIPTVFGRVSWVGLALLGPNGKYDAIFYSVYIDASKTPWSVNMTPCLKKLPLFATHEVLLPKHLDEWLKKETLKQRLNGLELITRKAIASEVAALRKQDERLADKTAAKFLTRLTTIIQNPST